MSISITMLGLPPTMDEGKLAKGHVKAGQIIAEGTRKVCYVE